MAKMFPSPAPPELRNDPARDGERLVYEALESGLSPQYKVFYSVRWLSKTRYAQDGEADFIIAHPEKGVLVIEVKGGIIAYTGGAKPWFSTPRSGGAPIPIKDPVAQALRNKFGLVEKIRELPGWSVREFPFAHAVCFPHSRVDQINLNVDLPRDIVIDGSDLTNIQGKIDAIFRFWHGEKPRHELGGDGMGMLHNLLSPSWQSTLDTVAQDAGAERQILAASERQALVLRLLGGQRRAAIRGGAGTGKTLLAVEKATQLAREGFRVLLTCYNRSLADHLRRQLAGKSGIDVFDFHQLCLEFARRAGVPLDQAAPSPDFFERELPEALLTALERIPDRYDAIIVDEGQDFSDDYWVSLTCALQDPNSGILYVFYDDNQDLFRPPALPDGFPQPFQLTENYRNTSQIHSVAKAFYGQPEEMLPMGPTGDKVFFKRVEEAGQLGATVESILDLLTERGILPRNIAVLTGRGVDKSNFIPLRRLGRILLTRDQDREPDRVLVETIFRFKGLERQAIVMTEIDNLDPDEDMAAYYVGLTRARLRLIVVGGEAAIARLESFVKARNSARADAGAVAN
jgi:nuclease-like protein/UvrD-like helicase family protein/AAA domain-containing protein